MITYPKREGSPDSRDFNRAIQPVSRLKIRLKPEKT